MHGNGEHATASAVELHGGRMQMLFDRLVLQRM